MMTFSLKKKHEKTAFSVVIPDMFKCFVFVSLTIPCNTEEGNSSQQLLKQSLPPRLSPKVKIRTE